jgi:hypothetical protein
MRRLLRRDYEVVEKTLRIGFGPQADFAGLGKGSVPRFEVLFAVQKALNVIARLLDGNRVPGARGYLDALLSSELNAFAGDNLVHAEIVFKRIHPGDVVIVCILVAPDESASLIVLAPKSFERSLEPQILVARFLGDAKVKKGIGAFFRFRVLGLLSDNVIR